jgi:hypothetical protein
MNEQDADSTPPNSAKPDGWELVCLGILRSEFGRRPSRAVSKAMLHLTAQEAAAGQVCDALRRRTWRERLAGWFSTWPPRPALAGALAIVLVAGVAAFFLKSHDLGTGGPGRDSIAGCTVTDAAGLRWASDSPRVKVGGVVPAGWLRLNSGVLEITFASTAKVALEGPAQFELTGGNSMKLGMGKISTDVPKHAKGFVVQTPTATVTDLGTRFGTLVGKDQASEVDVFQGQVKLTTPGGPAMPLSAGMAMFVDQHVATPASALPESAFPRPNLAVEVRPQNCGFDVSARAAVGEVPLDFGYWSGISYCLTGAVDGVNPASGPGMLEFYNSSASARGNSEVWQCIDLRPYKTLLAGGEVVAKLSALFNRVAGGPNTPRRFGLAFAAFHGLPDDSKRLWAARSQLALAVADTELESDDKPETWQPLEADAKLPPETDFVIIQIRAVAPPDAPASALAGHFADLIDLRLCTPMRGSSIAMK